MALFGFHVRCRGVELVDFFTDALKVWVQAVRGAEYCQGYFFGWQDRQLLFCGHGESLPRCSQRLKVWGLFGYQAADSGAQEQDGVEDQAGDE
ncbi:hypothetical protein, partial [Pseudomonas proteolytica]|uniref:hypothetical protein n=1 Tax=Pseudomonas proteolytica TaxID=219574 RepID=UPI0021CC6B42